MVIIINGMSESGKDTFVELCKKESEHVYNISSIQFVKYIASQCGWENFKTDEYRNFLYDLKMLMEKYNDYANVVTIREIDRLLELDNQAIVFVHIREPHNIEKYVKQYNAKTLLVSNPRKHKANTNADIDVNHWVYDYVIENDKDLKHLKHLAKNFMKGVTK